MESKMILMQSSIPISTDNHLLPLIIKGDVYLQPHDQIRPLLLPNYYAVCNKLQTHERINRNNEKLKEIDENDWNTTTCPLFRLKSAFVDMLASD